MSLRRYRQNYPDNQLSGPPHAGTESRRRATSRRRSFGEGTRRRDENRAESPSSSQSPTASASSPSITTVRILRSDRGIAIECRASRKCLMDASVQRPAIWAPPPTYVTFDLDSRRRAAGLSGVPRPTRPARAWHRLASERNGKNRLQCEKCITAIFRQLFGHGTAANGRKSVAEVSA